MGRVCSKCGGEDFYGNGKGGCKACASERHRAKYAADPEKYRAKSVEWRKAHPEEARAIVRASIAKKRDVYLGRKRAYCAAHKEEAKERNRVRRQENPEETRRSNVRRYGLTLEQVQTMIDEQHGRCGACGDRLTPGRGTCIDHDHSTGDVRGILCQDCNRAEGLLRGSSLRCRKLAAYIDKHAPRLPLKEIA